MGDATGELKSSGARLALPLPPTFNQAWKPGRRADGKASLILAEEQKRFRRIVWTEVRAQLGLPIRPIPGRLMVRLELYQATRIRQDIDNRIKALLDALKGAGVFEDDSQVDRLIVTRAGLLRGGGCIVEVMPLPGDDPCRN